MTHSQCEGPGLIPGQGTGLYMPQLSLPVASKDSYALGKIKILHVANKTQHSCIYIYIYIYIYI